MFSYFPFVPTHTLHRAAQNSSLETVWAIAQKCCAHYRTHTVHHQLYNLWNTFRYDKYLTSYKKSKFLALRSDCVKCLIYTNKRIPTINEHVKWGMKERKNLENTSILSEFCNTCLLFLYRVNLKNTKSSISGTFEWVTNQLTNQLDSAVLEIIIPQLHKNLPAYYVSTDLPVVN
jgi:hypothetical protein